MNEEEKKDKEKNTLTPYILLMALSLHGIFEGIALGVLNNNSAHASYYFIYSYYSYYST